MSDTVLICHALSERDVARLLAHLLESAGKEAVLSPPFGDTESPASLPAADPAFVIVGAATASTHVRTEVAYLAARAAANADLRLVPILLPGSTLDDWPELASFATIDLRLEGSIVDWLGDLVTAAPLLGLSLLQASRRRPDLLGGLIIAIARRWWEANHADRAERLFDLAAELLAGSEGSRPEKRSLLAAIEEFGLAQLKASRRSAKASSDDDALKALTARLGAWAGELLEREEYAAARHAFERLLPLARAAFGNAATTLSLASGLARSLRGLGELAAAEELERDTVVRLQEHGYGVDDPATLAAISNLATTLSVQGKLAEAQALQESVLSTRRRALGKAHPETLTAKTNLAATLYAQGDLVGARVLQEDTLATRRGFYGNDHPETLSAAWNLLVTCLAMNDGEAVGKLFDSDLAPLFDRDAATLPAGLARVRTNLENLAGTLHVPDDIVEVQMLQAPTPATLRRKFGEEHPNALKVAVDLADNLWRTGQPLAAIAQLCAAAEELERTLGADHEDTRAVRATADAMQATLDEASSKGQLSAE
ncbi:MAG: tetratricopeptide repeat protein [Rhodocyclales bacterium]|nr:tetratricopeptide repeat protein [Rhodocyclales bacterium]